MARKAMALFSLVWTASPAFAADWTGYASIGSDYIYRGVSLLDSGLSAQGGAEATLNDVFIVGGNAARVDRQWVYDEDVRNHLQLDFYAGTDFGCGTHCRARLLLSRYVFPGSNSRDWFEGTAALSLFERGGISISWSPHGLGSNERSRTFEGWLQQPLANHTAIEFGYGRVLIEDLDYWYARVGISHRAGRFVIDLSEHWSDHGLRNLAHDDRSRRAVLTISTGF